MCERKMKMKTEKYLCETLKAILKEQKVAFWSHGDDVVISKDGYSAIVIPKSKNPFNFPIKDNDIIPVNWESNGMLVTENLKISAKKTCRILKCETWETLIEENILKYFDGVTIKFYQPAKNSAIYITEYDILCGLILPVKDDRFGC